MGQIANSCLLLHCVHQILQLPIAGARSLFIPSPQAKATTHSIWLLESQAKSQGGRVTKAVEGRVGMDAPDTALGQLFPFCKRLQCFEVLPKLRG
jgi:hypothetical protein